MFTIEMDGKSAKVTVNKKGSKHSKYVDIGNLMAVMQQHAVHDFGLLPANTRYLAKSGNNYTIAVEMPARTCDLQVLDFRDSKKIKTVKAVNLPASIAFFQLIQKEDGFYHSTSFLFALEGQRLFLEKDKLYKFPLPNIHHEDNRICWGNNDMSERIKSLAGVEGWLRSYFAAPFNSDLFDTKKMASQFPWNKLESTEGRFDVEGLFKLLADKPFDVKWLTPPEGGFDTFLKATEKLGK